MFLIPRMRVWVGGMEMSSSFLHGLLSPHSSCLQYFLGPCGGVSSLLPSDPCYRRLGMLNLCLGQWHSDQLVSVTDWIQTLLCGTLSGPWPLVVSS